MKQIIILSALFVAVGAQAESVCKAFRAEYSSQEESTRLVEQNSISSSDSETLPTLTDSEKYMVQTAVLLNSNEASNITAALKTFFLGSGDNGEGSVTYFKLTYQDGRGPQRTVDVAQAKFYGGGNPIGALFKIVRFERGEVYAELLGTNGDDDIRCLTYE
jgi:hypothetical protein